MNRETHIHPELANDPDYQAFMIAEKTGLFANLVPGTLVVFFNGKFITSAPDFETLYQKEVMQKLQGVPIVHAVNVEIEKKTLRRGPRLASNRQK